MDFYYQFLSSNSRKIYKSLVHGLQAFQNSIFLPGCFSDEFLTQIIQFVSYDHPELFYVDFSRLAYLKGALGIKFEPAYAGSPSQLKHKRECLQSQAMGILSKMHAARIETPYAKVRWIHNYLIRYIHYDYQSLQTSGRTAHNIVGVLQEKRAVCEGIAKTFLYLCSLEQIQAALMTGSANGGEMRLEETSLHAWNLVCLDDTWYHIDCTFDLCQSQEVNANRYDYFCLSDADMMKDHTFESRVVCPSNDKSYFQQTHRSIKSPRELKAFVRKALDAEQKILYFKLAGNIYDMNAALNRAVSILQDTMMELGHLDAYRYSFNTAQGILYFALMT